MDVFLNSRRAASTLGFLAKSPENPSLWIMPARAMEALASLPISPGRSNAAASAPVPTSGPDESEERARFDAATAAAAESRPVAVAAASEDRLALTTFLPCVSFRICPHLSLDSRGDLAAQHDVLIAAREVPQDLSSPDIWHAAVRFVAARMKT